MGFFHRFARMHGHFHHHFGGHHGHHGHHGHEGSHLEHIADRIAGRLDLDEGQQDKLADLLEAVWAQRAAVKSPDLVGELASVIQGERLDRDAARALADQRIAALQAGVTPVVDALGTFYDALDAEQQQAVGFMLRMRGRFGGRFGRGFGDRKARGSAQ